MRQRLSSRIIQEFHPRSVIGEEYSMRQSTNAQSGISMGKKMLKDLQKRRSDVKKFEMSIESER